LGTRENAENARQDETTPSWRAAAGPADFDKLIREAERRSPSHETPTVEDVGAMVAFLVSDDARHITGNVTFIDSGYHIMG
jgi:enoyl-[acyl-carrier protein] reductase I